MERRKLLKMFSLSPLALLGAKSPSVPIPEPPPPTIPEPIRKLRPHWEDPIDPPLYFSDFVISNEADERARNHAMHFCFDKYCPNPLFLVGLPNTGKTRLLRTIACERKRFSPTAYVAYVTAHHFLNDIVHAIRFDYINKWRAYTHSLNVLLIDDFDFFEGRPFAQEEMISLFNDLDNNGHRIAFAATIPRNIEPHELLNKMNYKLLARLERYAPIMMARGD